MKIPREVAELQNKNSLLVVVGHHYGLLYNVSDGKIEKIDELKIEEPKYSDNEGLFKRGGSGDDYTFGSVLEPKKEKYEKDFSKSIAKKVLNFSKKNNLDQIYLFCPREMKSLVKGDWNEGLRNMIAFYFEGNYTKEHPIEISKMIREKSLKDNYKEPQGQAKQILDKFGEK